MLTTTARFLQLQRKPTRSDDCSSTTVATMLTMALRLRRTAAINPVDNLVPPVAIVQPSGVAATLCCQFSPNDAPLWSLRTARAATCHANATARGSHWAA